MAKTTKKKSLTTLLVVVLLAVVAIGGMLAYLTDRDSETNVFTVGDVKIDLVEDYDQDSKLLPGVDVKKEAYIENLGANDAWVWMTVAVPEDVDSVVKTNDFDASKWTAAGVKDENIKGVDYKVYTYLYNTVLASKAKTDLGIKEVFLDQSVDYNVNDEKYYTVVNGIATEVKGDVENTIVYVSAYAIQAENFDTVQEAFDAYGVQWGDKGTEYKASITNNNELDEAIKAGETTLVLDSGIFIVPDSAQGKTLHFIGTGDTVIATQDDGSYEGCDYSLDGATATFENITINTDSTTYTGYARFKGTFKNCIINGTYTLYDNSTFEKCTFNVSGDVYNIWTWGAPNATFDSCTFNSDGKAILLYGTANTKLTVNDCEFNDNGGLSDLKAAIEIGNDYDKSYELIVNNTVVNGYEINDKGINTGTTLWANKNSMGTDKLNVVVDGVDVY